VKLTKLDNRDVYELDWSDEEGADELEGDVVHVKFSNADDVSVRDAIAAQQSCTVTVPTGFAGDDDVVISDDSGHEVEGSVSFG